MINYSAIYFPQGCSICGGTVNFHNDIYKYICEECEAWADSHRKATIKNELYEPTESLAGEYIHNLRAILRHIFGKLYADKIQRINKGEPLQTTIINIIYPDNIISYNDGWGTWYAKQIYSNDGFTQIEYLSTGQQQYVKDKDINKVSNRSKALIWLAKHLSMSFDKCKIGYLNKQQLKQAIEICSQAYIKGAEMSLEY